MLLANLQVIRNSVVDEEFHDRLQLLAKVLLANAPIMLLSLILPAYLVAVCVLAVSWKVFYPLTASFQYQLFTLSLKRAFLQIAIPMVVIQILWLFALLSMHRQIQLAAAQLPMLILSACALAPLYRSPKSTRTERRFAYKWSYVCAAALVFVHETMLLWSLA